MERRDHQLVIHRTRNYGSSRKQARARGERTPTKDGRKTDTDTRKWPKWKDVAPTGSQPQVMKRDNKTFHWCSHHARWTVHKPSECNLAQENTPSVAAEATTNATNNRHTAMTTVTADSESDSDGGYDTADSNN
mmetsp:Transcript_22107/g.31668  ORF Transcript_22107/g.31668 Transcript_22107/m.31668 type:complete len:134 (-) Transcript_22107:127-528(-)